MTNQEALGKAREVYEQAMLECGYLVSNCDQQPTPAVLASLAATIQLQDSLQDGLHDLHVAVQEMQPEVKRAADGVWETYSEIGDWRRSR